MAPRTASEAEIGRVLCTSASVVGHATNRQNQRKTSLGPHNKSIVATARTFFDPMTARFGTGTVEPRRMLKLIYNRREDSPLSPMKRPADELGMVVDAAAKGDPRATRTLVHAVGPHVLRSIRAVLGREHPFLDDVAQEAIVEFLGALARFRAESTVVHFACRIAVLCAMHHRRMESARKRTVPYAATGDDTDGVEASVSNDLGPEDSTVANRSSNAVLELLNTLPDAQADAFALHAILGYTTTEIADSLEVPLETVRSRLRLARQALRRKVLANPVLREALEEP
jgi:RNA polymerase sigma factor (sigma-70 family)